MKVLMIEIPSGGGEGSVPFGVLYAASSIAREGHTVRILDLAKHDMDFSLLGRVIEELRPDAIGMGGITSGYANCKSLISEVRKKAGAVPIVIGGVISSVSKFLLERAGADFVVHGEAEVSFPALLRALEDGKDPGGVKGISLLRDGKEHRTPPEAQIPDLDDIPMPDFDLLDIKEYLSDVGKWTRIYFGHDGDDFGEAVELLSKKKNLFPIISARGCTHKCIFCYRHQAKWRQHSVGYVVAMMRHLKEKYGVDVFQINDELTTANKQWVFKFCDELIRTKMDVLFIVLSSRVDNIIEEMLVRLKKAGCVMINYGYESGADPVLKEIQKGVTRARALETGLLTKKVGIKNVPEIIVGFSSETEETVAETIDFLKQLDAWPVSINTPIPFPQTPLWNEAVKRGIIKDEEAFISDYQSRPLFNFTRYPDHVVQRMVAKVKHDVLLNWLKRRGKYAQYAKVYCEGLAVIYLKPRLPKGVYWALRGLWGRVLGVGRY